MVECDSKNAYALAHLICDCLKYSLVIRYYIGCKFYVRSFLVKHKHHSGKALYLSCLLCIVEEAMEEASKEGCVLPKT
ncbi:hypothetical protein IGI04_033937 [Brassica rapa subsp. trilocularis]|uniref:Uncharacterized protein n=1 Tax=Brassica rapa subsp. trilocularis TaxID=1813537 RepID=A0ABQ7L879_BRACM|nr:hypothetical protein IGI04_033937 [Brassica rapa subsp. trilocularis]